MKKVHFEKIPHTNKSFNIKEEEFPFLNVNWHVHPEFEIALITHNHCQTFVGDNIRDTFDTELLFLGPNLPHAWISRQQDKNPIKNCKQTTIHFNPDFIGLDFWNKPEMKHIDELFNQSRQGISFSKQIHKDATFIINNILKENSFKRIIELLSLLDLLAKSQDQFYLSSTGFTDSKLYNKTIIINKVLEFIQNHYKEDLTLNQIANEFGMSPQYFCHFFKKRTKKTFITFLNDIRLGNACRFLMEDKLTISEICFESGFNNISNFNRRFKKYTGESPRDYKKAMFLSNHFH